MFNKFKLNFWDFPKQLVFRPFKSLDSLKDESEGNLIVPFVFILLLGILNILEYQYLGFIFNEENPRELNSIVIFVTTIFPFFLLVISNWAITTLVDGKGKLLEIFKVLGYSLFSIIIMKSIGIFISNFIIQDELMIYKIIMYTGYIGTGFTLFLGLLVIHEFSLGKTFFVIILTVFVYLVVIFILLLFFGLLQQVFGFSGSLIEEIIYRIRG